MARRKKRAGMAYCIVSTELVRGLLHINGVAIFPDKEARDRHDEERGGAASRFPADIWIEEH